MSSVKARPDSNSPRAPSQVPGLIEGEMTMYREADGSVSFRVIIGTAGRGNDQHDLLELVISADNIGNLIRGLADPGTADADCQSSVPPLPCRIGFCRDAIGPAA